jgi:hypothetical protein
LKFQPGRKGLVAGSLTIALVAMVTGFSIIAGGSASAAPITTNATADSYVSGAASSINYGTSTTLIANSKGPVYTHLKFVVSGSNGAKSATLEVYSTSSGTLPTQVFSEPATWTETAITYANQPVKGTSLGNLSTLAVNAYSIRSVPINGDGSYAFVLTTTASSPRNMQSREAPNPPKLIFTPVVAGSSTAPTSSASTVTATSTPNQTVTVTNTVTNTVTAAPVTTTALSTVTQPPVTSTVATTVTQPPVTNTVTVTPSPITSTITVTPAPVTNTVTVTPAPVTSTVTITPAPVTNTVTITPAPVTTTATVTQPPVTTTVTSATTSTVTAPTNSTTATTPTGSTTTSSTTPSTPTSSTAPTTPTTSTSAVGPSGGVIRAAFYYPWYPETWGTVGTTYPFSNYKPTLGYYKSDDPAIIAQHVAAMQYAHLDAAISSWWGQGQHSESTRFPMQLAAAAGTGFKWGLYYEKEGFGDPTVPQISGDLSYIQANYASNPSFLTKNGKPVILVYADANDGCAMADRWKLANGAVGNAFYIVLKVFSGFPACASQPDSWHQYGPATGLQDFPGRSESISPGYFKKGDAGATLPRDITLWSTRVANMVKTNEPLQLITTFNEWGEGTAVESADDWPSTSGYGSYVDVLHDLIPASHAST